MATGIALVISALALVAAVWANITSRDAAKAAETSAKAAEESNEIAREARAQALEISDVDWNIERVGDEIRIRNIGQSIACAVAALVLVDGVRFDSPGVADVPSDEFVAFDVGDALKAKLAAKASRIGGMSGAGYGSYSPPGLFRVEARMTWQTSAGTGKAQVIDPVSFRVFP